MRPTLKLPLRIFTMALLGALCISSGGDLSAQSRLNQARQGKPWKGSRGVKESVDSIQKRERSAPRREIEFEIEVRRNDKRKTNPQNPGAREDVPSHPHRGTLAPNEGQAQAQAPSDEIFSPQTVGTSFTGATVQGINPTFAVPPDSMGAVGPTQYIVMVNGRIVSFNKTTGVADGVINADTDTFFTSVRNGSGTSDPRIRYDRLSGRWFLVIINVSTPNRILIAVSSEGPITNASNFTFFFIPIATTPPAISSTCLMDYPTLGIDANALYIGGNNFCGSPSQVFNSTDGYVIRKSDLLVGTLTVTAFRGLVPSSAAAGPYTPQGVDNYDSASTEGYFIGVDNATFGTLMLRRVSTPGATPSISANISIATPLTTSFPLDVNHLGNTLGANGRLDALDDRLFAAHMRNGQLWTAHNIGVNNTGTTSGTLTRDAVRWYQIQGIASPSTPSFVQSGTVFTASGTNLTDQLNYWIPSIMVSGQGHAALGFSTAGTNARVNAGTVGRLSNDTLGSMQTPVSYTASTTAYDPSFDTGGPNGRRWGDYSYTSLDPNDDMTMWTIQEFCDATNSYALRIVKLIAPPPATPASTAPPSVANGQSSVSVTLTGTAASGSGFFDPGAGFLNRIGASVTGGVVVNSITYVNPTTVTLSLNTVGVPAGNYNVTITNPDGQSAVGANVLTITSSSLIATSTALASNLNPSEFGSPVTFTATVTPGAATGTITFLDGVTTLGTGPLSSGVATFATSNLSVGSHSITASYGGDVSFAGSVSPTVVQVVNAKKRKGQVTSDGQEELGELNDQNEH